MPAAGIPGRLYYTSDTTQVFRDNGASWDNVTPSLNPAAITAIQQESYVYAADTGVANAYVVSLNPAPTIVAGSLLVMKAAHANTGASTIAVNGAAAVAITKNGASALVGGEIGAGQIVYLIYDGTEWQLLASGGAGSVTSVAIAVPVRQSVSGSPITGSGTITISDNNQSAGTAFMGPASGGAAAPTFRAIQSSDTPLSVIGFVMNTGATGSNVGPMLVASKAGSFTRCVVVIKTSDAATALTFTINKNGASVFSSNPTVAAGTASGTVSTVGTLVSSPLTVNAGDTLSIDITSGNATWVFTAQLE